MRDYFCGWYFKCQSATHTLAVIPAEHRSKKEQSCSIQLITDEHAWHVNFPYDVFRTRKSKPRINIEKNHFSEKGIRLDLTAPGLQASGALSFQALTPIKYDIMGPFRYVPFMECRHSVVSMNHTVNGTLQINGMEYRFQDAAGYIEGDRGCSFPREYAWTQCCFQNGSLMLSVADIPLGRFHFTGIICVIHLCEQEYRLATYLGAKAVKIRNGELIIKQGNMMLSAKLLEKNAQPLAAPAKGVMNRIIRESASCRAVYRFQKDGQTILDFETTQASFEYEYAF